MCHFPDPCFPGYWSLKKKKNLLRGILWGNLHFGFHSNELSIRTHEMRPATMRSHMAYSSLGLDDNLIRIYIHRQTFGIKCNKASELLKIISNRLRSEAYRHEAWLQRESCYSWPAIWSFRLQVFLKYSSSWCVQPAVFFYPTRSDLWLLSCMCTCKKKHLCTQGRV